MTDSTTRRDILAVALLPRTGQGAAHPLSQTGTWNEDIGFGRLFALSSAMTKGRQMLSLASVTAMPYVWGQAVCFHAAFHTPSHPLHDAAVSEWRGLLAVLALRALRDIPFDISVVNLAAMAQNPFAESTGIPARTANFGRVVRDSFPTFFDPRKGMSDGAEHIDVFKFGDIPFGFTFASTLVVPGRDYCGAFDPVSVPWGTWGHAEDLGYPLRDPLSDDVRLADSEYVALQQFLTALRDQVQRMEGETVTRLLAELDAFREDVAPRLGDRRRVFDLMYMGPHHDHQPKSETFRWVLFRVPIEQHGDSPVTGVGDGGKTRAESRQGGGYGLPFYDGEVDPTVPQDLRIDIRRDLRVGAVKGAVFVDPSMRAAWSDVRLPLGDRRVGDLTDRNPQAVRKQIDEWRDDFAKEGWLLVTPDDLFTDQLR